jgi:hypothetical protein
VAPTVLFFAFTGSLQLFGLHEAHDGYQPPALIEKLGRLHKDQRLEGKARRADGPLRTHIDEGQGDWVAPVVRPPPAAVEATPIRELALKWLFLLSALMLMTSTSLGVWMAITQNRRKVVLGLLFLAGLAAPADVLLI